MVNLNCNRQMRPCKTGIKLPMVLLGLTLGLMATPVRAVPTVSPGFFATQNAAEDFFKVGRQHLEHEIRRLEQRQSQRPEKILQVDDNTKLNEKELENWERLDPQHQLHQKFK